MDDVVIDEWIVIRALGLENEPGSAEPDEPKDFRPAELLAFVQESCRWVISDQTIEIYLGRVYEPQYKGTIWRRIWASIYDVVVDPNRRTWINDPPDVPGAYHHKDKPWVGAAAAAGGGCRLITGDDNLVLQLETSGVAAREEIVPMGIAAAHAWMQTRAKKQPEQGVGP